MNAQNPDQELNSEDLEAAYLQALEATADIEIAAVELTLGDEELEASPASDSDPQPAPETEEPAPSRLPHVTPMQVIEALLFVGGTRLTAKRLAMTLGNDTQVEQVLEWIEQLNKRYLAENRPYTIPLKEGGYAFELREDFEDVRRRMYGLGPREVKLPTKVVELLSFIAYRQPVQDADFAQIKLEGIRGLLRQLIKRNLVASIEMKNEKQETIIGYQTTSRFLEVFGLQSLEDLPRPQDLSRK